jgi:prepilin-type N-terminal cleavage/methylation domain-containing protein/prepilin-type processing-associated H-X9-DG protein
MRSMSRRTAKRGFSLIELMVVLGVILILIALLLPTLRMARQNALSLKCQSNLQQIGQSLLIYANNNGGWLYPPGRGAVPGAPTSEYWTCFVFKPPVWNPPILLCPADSEPAVEHSYVLNYHLKRKAVRYHSTRLGGKSSSDVVLMGEKRTDAIEYYMDAPDYDAVVEKSRHGLRLKSNYLYLDLHVDKEGPTKWVGELDPWDLDIPLNDTPIP